MVFCSGKPDASVVSEDKVLGSHSFTPSGSNEPMTFNVTRGDYAPLMQWLSENLQKAVVSEAVGMNINIFCGTAKT